jgi:hypothetical protein
LHEDLFLSADDTSPLLWQSPAGKLKRLFAGARAVALAGQVWYLTARPRRLR